MTHHETPAHKAGLLNLLVIALLVISGCSSSKNVATVDAPAEPTVMEVAQEPEIAEPAEIEETEVEPAEQPEDWYQKDVEVDGLPGISLDRAYETILYDRTPARTVVVAVIDSGVDIEHEDVAGNVWVNEDETAGNGIDDDGNGYIDDVHGWNFIGGTDGRHVANDTFEFVREYAKLAPKYKALDPSEVSDVDKAEYEYYLQVKAAYDTERDEMGQIKTNIDGAVQATQIATTVLSGELGKADFTLDEVAAIESDKQDVQRAKGIMLYLDEIGVTAADLLEQKEEIDVRLEYGLDPTFNPRSIVGDNYSDNSERYYGNNDVEGPDPSHGTHVSGIIGAVRSNGVGVDGVAPEVRIMVIRAVPNGDERDKDVANAIRYAADNGAHVINMSFGKSFSPGKSTVDEAVRYAGDRGILLVHAAGNDGSDNDLNASYPNRTFSDGTGESDYWIEVGASSPDKEENLAASFSNYGAKMVDLFAPGTEIYSTMPENEYESLDGTSMAAPVVSGVAALIMTYYPSLTAAQVRSVILDSARQYSGHDVQRPGTEEIVDFSTLSRTGGIVNALKALEMAEALAN